MTKSSSARATARHFAKTGHPIAAPQPAVVFPATNGQPLPMRISVGPAQNFQTYSVELLVGGFENEAAAQAWAAVLQGMLERYAGGKTGPAN